MWCERRLTVLLTQVQPIWGVSVFRWFHGWIFGLNPDPVNLVFDSLHLSFSGIPPCLKRLFLVVYPSGKRESSLSFASWNQTSPQSASFDSRMGRITFTTPHAAAHGCPSRSLKTYDDLFHFSIPPLAQESSQRDAGPIADQINPKIEIRWPKEIRNPRFEPAAA